MPDHPVLKRWEENAESWTALARAGYDPGIAARFWREAGPRLLAGMIRSRSHPPVDERVALATREAARLRRRGASLPAFYEQREAPLDGNWRRYTPEKPR